MVLGAKKDIEKVILGCLDFFGGRVLGGFRWFQGQKKR